MNWKKHLENFLIANKKNGYRPVFFRTHFLFSFLVVVFALRVVFLPFYLPFSRSLLFSKVVSSQVVDLLNREREKEDLGLLESDPRLVRAAELKARDMLEKDYFAHQSPEGVPGWHFIRKAGYEYRVAGENLAIGFLDSQEVHKAWKASPLHKRNLLDKRFEEVGVSVSTGNLEGKRTTVVVQFFGAPSSAEVREGGKTESPGIGDPEGKGKVLPEETKNPEGNRSPEEPESTEELETAKENNSPEKKQGVKKEMGKREMSVTAFFVKKYNNIARRLVFALSGLTGGLLLFNLGLIAFKPLKKRVKFTVSKHLLFEGGAALLFLLFLAMVNKVFILQLIPHVVQI